MCRVEIILIVFFLWSLFILFFVWGKKRFDGVFISWDKKTIVVQKVAAFERKIGFIILHTLYKAFTAGVGVQKGRRL